MPDVLAVETTNVVPLILYPWMAFSVGVYAYRFYRRRTGKRTSTAPVIEDEAPPSTTRVLADAIKDPERPVPTIESRQVRPGSLVEQVIREELEARQRGEAEGATTAPDAAEASGRSSGRSGLFAGGAPATPATPDAPRTSPTVADALRGIEWPCDLAPLVTGDLNPHRVAFITKSASAAEVAVAVADELERLGYALLTESDTVAVARRDDDEVKVIVHPDPTVVERGDAPAFPTATRRSVVVEFAT